MRKIREIFRLKYECRLSNRQIARSCSISHSTVGDYLKRFSEAGLSWLHARELDEEALNKMLFPLVPILEGGNSKPLPDWKIVDKEFRKKGVTLLLLWQEYHECYPQGYRYSQFCELYKKWKRKLHVSMRQNHKGGEKMFIDYCGQTVDVRNSHNGEVIKAQIFVAVLGASNYTYAEAHHSQNTTHWIGGHVRAFNYFGGVPEIAVPDNLKAGVKTPCRYEPVINRSYHQMARYYQMAVIPARVRKPKDKSKAEVGVQIVQRWILAVLRKRVFFSIQELNQAIKELLEHLNNREMKHLGQSRKELFESIEKPFLKPLPQNSYDFWEWGKATVPPDYHVKFDHNYYSVPYRYIQHRVDIRANERILEVFCKDKLIASHKRCYEKHFTSTRVEHMPKKHRKIAEVTPQHLMAWSQKVGISTHNLIECILSSERHPEQTYRQCLGILRLSSRYGEDRLEAACKRSLHFGIITYRGIASILKNGCESLSLPELDDGTEGGSHRLHHSNIRGVEYYGKEVATC